MHLKRQLIKLYFGRAEAIKYRHQPKTQAATVNDFSDGQKYAYGISGICEIFGCSKPTAQLSRSYRSTTPKEKEIADARNEA